jgi:hypothetical protein
MVIDDRKAVPPTTSATQPSRDYVIKECASCKQSFVSKYWDSNLACYVELNLTRCCTKCRKSGQS